MWSRSIEAKSSRKLVHVSVLYAPAVKHLVPVLQVHTDGSSQHRLKEIHIIYLLSYHYGMSQSASRNLTLCGTDVPAALFRQFKILTRCSLVRILNLAPVFGFVQLAGGDSAVSHCLALFSTITFALLYSDFVSAALIYDQDTL